MIEVLKNLRVVIHGNLRTTPQSEVIAKAYVSSLSEKMNEVDKWSN